MDEIIKSLKIKTILEGVFIGCLVGFIVSFYRLSLRYVGNNFTIKAYDFMRMHKTYIILGFIILAISFFSFFQSIFQP